MVDIELARDYCLKLPEVEEYDYFGKPAYRLRKKIIATLWLDERRAILKLSPTDQQSYCIEYSPVIFPVKGKWAKFGWTNVDLNRSNEVIFSTVLNAAWLNVAPKSMAKKYGIRQANH